ncbi:hypothetical protein Y710_11070 [Gordonia sp. QH-12]|uniref:hypothetical protein n=1 Tax=Gordonia sp. QH-12 TaxID=1437876 RepID=UPI0007834C4C|nr:hypothetical protein [Gordonia sp. QH-12]KXT57017.1 hypothetical protein Y710_11070 [Gordonia sp. QH-12]
MTDSERTLDLRVHLLDRQIIDCDGVPVGVVDDVEFDMSPGGQTPRVVALLTGRALLDRLVAQTPDTTALESIPAEAIADVGVTVELTGSGEDLLSNWPERWFRDQIVSRVPGSGGRR